MKPVDIITHTDPDNDALSFGILFEDGSVEWHETLEEAEYYWREKGQ
jgi:hypothetical protein